MEFFEEYSKCTFIYLYEVQIHKPIINITFLDLFTKNNIEYFVKYSNSSFLLKYQLIFFIAILKFKEVLYMI